MGRKIYNQNFLELLGLEGHVFTKVSFNLKYIFPAIYITLLTFLVPAVLYQGKWNSLSTITLAASLLGLAVNVVIGSKVGPLKIISGLLHPVYAYTTIIAFGIVSRVSMTDWLLATAFTIFGIIYWWIPSAGMSNAIRAVLNGIIIANEGDLNHRINLRVKRKDEIGMLAEDLNTFFSERQNFVRVLAENAKQLAATSQQLSGNAEEAAKSTRQVTKAIEEVAKGANEQTGNVTDTVSTVDQLTHAIEQIAAGAQEQNNNVTVTTELVESMSGRVESMAKSMEEVKNASQQNGLIAKEGGKAVEKTVVGMERVKNAVFETANRIKELGEQSKQIGEIIQVIDDIAEQTNLLALNAAIEAARAGEHGKGFAVVADEVRKLAERSGKATKEIADLITTIQKGTNIAVESMQVGTREVEQGVVVAQEAGKSLNEIVEKVEQAGAGVQETMKIIEEIMAGSLEVSKAISGVAAITEENTAATQEMSASAEQVGGAMQNISAATEESAAAAEQVSASAGEMAESIEKIALSADELDKMAKKLQDLVSQYQL